MRTGIAVLAGAVLLASGGLLAVRASAQPAAPAPAAPAPAGPTPAVPADTAADGAQLDVPKLFASTCGWCHSNAGRTAGRGPKLMGTALTDAEIMYRIKNGKTGAMPAFGAAFSDEQIRAIIAYIRGLKEEGQ